MNKDEQNEVGVDLDGTLSESCESDTYFPDQIGAPIPDMVLRVKRHIELGDVVVILTARVHPGNGEQAEIAREAIQQWCFNVFGRVFEITCMKSHKMYRIYDDRAITVERNTGKIRTLDFEEPCLVYPDSIGILLDN